MLEYIKKTLLEQRKEQGVYYVHNVPLNIVHQFTTDIDISYIINKLEQIIPEHLLKNVEVIYVANIKEFNKGNRTFNAMYKNDAIYISPHQDDEADLLDDIVHEVAHSIEHEYEDIIYGDGLLENEFLGKRKTLYFLLDEKPLNMLYFKDINYNAKFDNFMYNDIGYDKLNLVSSGLFYSPYAITSLREYWANGFENYLLGDRTRLKSVSPVLYSKIYTILEEE